MSIGCKIYRISMLDIYTSTSASPLFSRYTRLLLDIFKDSSQQHCHAEFQLDSIHHCHRQGVNSKLFAFRLELYQPMSIRSDCNYSFFILHNMTNVRLVVFSIPKSLVKNPKTFCNLIILNTFTVA